MASITSTIFSSKMTVVVSSTLVRISALSSSDRCFTCLNTVRGTCSTGISRPVIHVGLPAAIVIMQKDGRAAGGRGWMDARGAASVVVGGWR